MHRSVKLLLLAATLWPLLYVCGFLALMFGLVFSATQHGGRVGEPLGGVQGFVVLFGLHLFTMLWTLGLTAVYMVHLFKTDRVENDKKVLWAVVLFMGNMLAMPVYWHLNIWRDPAPSPSAVGTPGG
jgi:hypothetical protein